MSKHLGTVLLVLLTACAMTIDELRQHGKRVTSTHSMDPELAAEYVKAFHAKGCPGMLYLPWAQVLRESPDMFLVTAADGVRPSAHAAVVYEISPGRITGFHRFDNSREQVSLVVESIAAGRPPRCPNP